MDASALESLLRQPQPTYVRVVTTTMILTGSSGSQRISVVTTVPANATSLGTTSNVRASATANRTLATSARVSRSSASLSSMSATPATDPFVELPTATPTSSPTDDAAPSPTPSDISFDTDNDAAASTRALGFFAFFVLGFIAAGMIAWFFLKRRKRRSKHLQRQRGTTALRRDVELGRWRVASLWRTRTSGAASNNTLSDPVPEYEGKLPTYGEQEVPLEDFAGSSSVVEVHIDGIRRSGSQTLHDASETATRTSGAEDEEHGYDRNDGASETISYTATMDDGGMTGSSAASTYGAWQSNSSTSGDEDRLSRQETAASSTPSFAAVTMARLPSAAVSRSSTPFNPRPQ
ncbi:hypothetical protein PYCC9005_001529 [Savitreella phatthalungensis]